MNFINTLEENIIIILSYYLQTQLVQFDLFDFSDYPENSKFFDPVNKKVIGKMKDKVKGKTINEFVGLKSKIYSLVTVDNEKIRKAKRVSKNVVKS